MTTNREQQKTAVIIGCSRGIGYATVELLISKNFLVYAGVRSPTHAIKLDRLSRNNPNLEILEVDLEDEKSIKQFTTSIKKRSSKVDIIINSAGVIVFGPIETIELQQFYHQFQVNLFGPIMLVQELLPIMRKQKSGHILFLGSTSGVQSHGMYGTYAASKFALEAICHSLAVNLAQFGIRVSLIELSATATSIAKKTLQMGSRLTQHNNPYIKYTQDSLIYLQHLVDNGASPKTIAQAILDAIQDPKGQLRYFATEKSKDIFDHSLKDSLGLKWKKEAQEAIPSFSTNNH